MLRATYAQKALSQIPRLLSLQDRNPLSPTYGSFHRRYWLDKVDDFPDALPQFGVHSLALVYCHAFPDNPYLGQTRVRDWAIAGMMYWANIQHRDGTFDEFYPYERGWVGPTAFTTFAVCEAFQLLHQEMDEPVKTILLAAVRRAAQAIAQGEQEEDKLANHHAMACLALWKAYRLLGDKTILAGYERIWQGFLRHYHQPEGWSLEYDGVDPGYLSATISFLGKIYQENPTAELRRVLTEAVAFVSYVVYPDGYYGGMLGSRQTVHFYPHGLEIMAREMPTAAAIAQRLLRSLAHGGLVPPEIQADRYFLYRIPEFLQAYLDYTPRPESLPPLPYQSEPFRRYFSGAKIYAQKSADDRYLLVNAAKGGVLLLFDSQQEKRLTSDGGWLGQLTDGSVVTSQWIDPAYQIELNDTELRISGHLHKVPSAKLFTPARFLLFRLALLTVGWSPTLSHWLKGAIRRNLMLGTRPVAATFTRRLQLETPFTLHDQLTSAGVHFHSLQVGGEFFVRYVPQSRYFQKPELSAAAYSLTPQELISLHHKGQWFYNRAYS